jgi:periplasmic copper chaperone A
MFRISSCALAALIILSSAPIAFAHKGVLHDGCPTGQTYSSGLVTVSGAYARATPPGARAAGAYLTLTNTGNETDTLTGATSEAAHDIQIHQMSMNDGVMEMAQVEGGLSILPGSNVVLEPMGFHLMLMGMEQPFVEGQCIEMVLHFDKGGDMPIQLNIGGFAQDAPPDGTGAAPMGHDMHDMSSMEGM